MQGQSVDAKKARFYQHEAKNIKKEYQKLAKTTPLKSCSIIPTSLIIHDIDEIQSVTYKDSYGIEKTIASGDSPFNIIIYENMKIRKFTDE